jgi:hypothetical protein
MRTPGLVKLFRYLNRITNGERIPKLPRMYATEYTTLDPDSARIMTRYGIRSPSGLKLAMKRHNVTTVDQLVAKLEHHQAQRRIRQKLQQGLERLSSGTKAIPHQREIRQLVNPKRGKDRELQERLKRLKQV